MHVRKKWLPVSFKVLSYQVLSSTSRAIHDEHKIAVLPVHAVLPSCRYHDTWYSLGPTPWSLTHRSSASSMIGRLCRRRSGGVFPIGLGQDSWVLCRVA